MTNTKLPMLDAASLSKAEDTLTRSRLGKYLRVTRNNLQQALRLYVLNAKVSAAVMTDLHYIEIAMRNRFDRELTNQYGISWFNNTQFLNLLNEMTRRILLKAQRNAEKHWPKGIPLPPGKIIAELTFGFWLRLTDSKLEHTLWVPCLHKAFSPNKAPKRATFNQQLEKLRQLRNRVAHHEPIFHLDLLDTCRRIHDVAKLLCPTTARVMRQTSTVKRQVMKLNKYRQLRGI
ncbi:Abi family protein [Aquaspirillum serpens]|uniref:Abi family protein n=1 Tax=Aquaspirillum serpens TaxID=190 RepID=UPI00040C8A1F|nr:Abi family protein [Aquaspirillum serpens]